MEKLAVNGIDIYFPSEERSSAELLSTVTTNSLEIIDRLWGLKTPMDCRIYIMTSWYEFFQHAAPRQWQVLMKILSPILTPRMNRMWPLVGGWEQRFGSRITVGIKPVQMIADSDSSIGRQIFKQNDDSKQKFAWTACHELTHALSTHLNLPGWLKEGIAMLTVDNYAGEPTVLATTLSALSRPSGQRQPQETGSMRVRDPMEMISIYVRGYWITRYLEDTKPGLIKSLFDQRLKKPQFEKAIAAAYELPQSEFCHQIDKRVVEYFQHSVGINEMGSNESP